MTNILISLQGLPTRRTLARIVGYGLFGGELVGSVVVGVLTVATILGLDRSTIGL